MASFEFVGSASHAQRPWARTEGQDGTVKVTERKVGPIADIVSWVQGFKTGGVYELTATEGGCPFSGKYVGGGTSVEVGAEGVPGLAVGERYYLIPKGDSAGISGAESGSELDRRESLDVQPLEKPISEAKFWRNAYPQTCEGSGGGGDGLLAMKRVQLYIDASDEASAEALRGKLSSVEMKMAMKRLAGIEAFIVPAPTASLTYETTTKPSAVGDVGKVVTAPEVENVPVPGGFRWLCNGHKVEWSRGTGIYTVTTSWLGAETWDEDLYGKAATE